MREEIIKLLDQYRLKEALSQMTGYATHTSDWQLKNELEALQTSYDLMLQYTSKGMKDPNKVEIYHKMLRTAYELADRIHIAVQATQNYGAYYDTMRTFVQSPPHSYAELQMQFSQLCRITNAIGGVYRRYGYSPIDIYHRGQKK